MTEEELAAVSVALDLLQPVQSEQSQERATSRWKLAARLPDLGMEEIRALH